MKKKLVLLVALVLVMSSVLAACGGGGGDASGGNSFADTETIKVGVNYEKTGPVASYGQDSIDGVQTAIDEVNANGGIDGKEIELVVVDNKSDPAEATSLAERLMTEDKVVASLGPATSGNFKAVLPSAQTHGVPVVSASATSDLEITTDADGNVNSNVFRICFTDSFQGVTMANFANDNLGAKKAVIIKDTSSDYAKGLAENFKKTFEEQGGKIVAEEGYVAKDTDFSAVLTSIKNKDFDVIFLPGYYEEVGLIIKQARELGIDAPVLGADGYDSPELKGLAGATALNNVYFSNHYSSLDKDPAVVKFLKMWKDKKGGSPTSFQALGYDLGMFVADAIERAETEDSLGITNAMAATTDFVGVTGSFSIDEKHNPVKAVVVIGLKDGDQDTAVRVAAE